MSLSLMDAFVSHLNERLWAFPEARQRTLGKLINAIDRASVTYAEAVARHVLIRDAIQDGSSSKADVEQADRARTSAHEVLRDAVTIASRNIVGSSVAEHGPLKGRLVPLVNRDNPQHRHIVARAAFERIFALARAKCLALPRRKGGQVVASVDVGLAALQASLQDGQIVGNADETLAGLDAVEAVLARR